MKILILTQSVNKENAVLGFFHNWIEEISKHFDEVIVICLEKGAFDLPANVKVLSLGKEEKKSKFTYIYRFFKYIFKERFSYDSVFVHMNQEYLLLGGWLWKILGKDMYMWRNHEKGSFLTDIASSFCKNVFCTSKFSYTAKYKKTKFMPVGIDTNIFKPIQGIERKANSILFLARMAPVKRPDVLIEALGELGDLEFTATFIGDPLPKDIAYYSSLKEKVKLLGLSDRVHFEAGIKNADTPSVYSANEIFINLTSSGSFDKTMLEAMACGCILIASNDNLKPDIGEDYIFKFDDKKDLVDKIRKFLAMNQDEKKRRAEFLIKYTEKHNLKRLMEMLSGVIIGNYND